VLATLLSEWPQSAPLAARIPAEVFSHPIAKELLMALRELPEGTGTLDFSQLTSHLGADAGPLAAELLLGQSNSRAETPGESGDKSGLSRIHIPLLQLKIRLLEETARGLQPEIQDAVASGNLPGRDAAYRRKQALVEEIRSLKAELKAETARRI
jgi:hypothetical protein